MAIVKTSVKRDPAFINPIFEDCDSNDRWDAIDKGTYYTVNPESSQVYQSLRTGEPCPGMIVEREVTFEGCVCAQYSREERIMSDVWDMVYYAVVYSPNGKGEKSKYGYQLQSEDSNFRTVNLGCSNGASKHYGGETFSVTVDAEAWMQELLQDEKDAAAKKAAEEKAAREIVQAQERALQAYREFISPTEKGNVSAVIKGRSNAVGKVGVTFWAGFQQYQRYSWGTPMYASIKLGLGLSPAKGTVQNKDTGKEYKNSHLVSDFATAGSCKSYGEESQDEFWQQVIARALFWERQEGWTVRQLQAQLDAVRTSEVFDRVRVVCSYEQFRSERMSYEQLAAIVMPMVRDWLPTVLTAEELEAEAQELARSSSIRANAEKAAKKAASKPASSVPTNPDAPYGYKADGTPAKKRGRKAGSTNGQNGQAGA
jgi:phosphoribosyl-ATP pyrophosphohydrolase